MRERVVCDPLTGSAMQTPLWTLIGTSNRAPEEELMAVYDRFPSPTYLPTPLRLFTPPCPDSPVRQPPTRLYKTRRDLRLNTGPAWAEAKDSSLVIHVAGAQIAIENKRVVFSNTYQSLEPLYK